jgi:hypothetical protein
MRTPLCPPRRLVTIDVHRPPLCLPPLSAGSSLLIPKSRVGRVERPTNGDSLPTAPAAPAAAPVRLVTPAFKSSPKRVGMPLEAVRVLH